MRYARHVFDYNRANTRTSALKKLDFSQNEFGKGQTIIINR